MMNYDDRPGRVILKVYHMNKSEREITDIEEIKDLISRGKYTIISLAMEGAPYIVTMSYGYDRDNDRIYFHTAKKGLKLDIIRNNPACTSTIIEDLGYQNGECSHRYRSVVLYGKMREVTDLDEMKRGMMTMFTHLEDEPDILRSRFLGNDEAYDKICVLRMDISSMTGKKSA